MMKKLKIGLYSTLALLLFTGCSQESDTNSSTPVGSAQTAVDTDNSQKDVVEQTDVVISQEETAEVPALGPKPVDANAVDTLFVGEVYDLYQGQADKIHIEEFILSEDGSEIEGGEITETVEDYLVLVMLADEKTTPFYVTEETQFNEAVHDKETWLTLLAEANDLGFIMSPTQFDLEITYSEDEFGNFYVDYADITTSEKYSDSPSVDTASLDYSDTATVKIRYIFAMGDELMTITTFEGDRGDDSNDVEYRITDNTGYSSLDPSILDAQLKDAILAHGSSLSEDSEMVCNLYWNADDTYNDYQNLSHIELVSFG